MPEGIGPRTFAPLLAAFEGCFTAPTYRLFGLVAAGGLHCAGRRTITAVAVASGAVGARRVSGFHRFLGRATWSLDAVGRVVLTLAQARAPADQPRLVLVDDTLARQGGKGISPATMHRDPLLSTARTPFGSFGHVGVVPARWVPLPLGDRPARRHRLRPRAAPGRRAGPAGAGTQVDRPPLVPRQGRPVLPRPAHRRPAGALAPRPFCAAVLATVPLQCLTAHIRHWGRGRLRADVEPRDQATSYLDTRLT